MLDICLSILYQDKIMQKWQHPIKYTTLGFHNPTTRTPRLTENIRRHQSWCQRSEPVALNECRQCRCWERGRDRPSSRMRTVGYGMVWSSGTLCAWFFSVALKRPPESALGLLLYDPKPDIIEKILEVYIHHSDPTWESSLIDPPSYVKL